MKTAKNSPYGAGLEPIYLIGVSSLFIAHASFFNFLNDDAFISFRYADNLVRHGQLVFNPGEYVEGYTNFLWTLSMAGVLFVGLDPALWSRILGVGFGLVTLWVITHFFRRQTQSNGITSVIPALLLAAAPAYACWSTGGLETQMFTTFLTLGWVTYLTGQSAQSPHYRRCGLWLAMASMTRPEGMLVAGLLAVGHLGTAIVAERRLRPNRREITGLFSFAALFVPYFAWRWWYYGWPLPNTYYVKAGAGSFWGRGWEYFGSWIVDHGLWVAPLFMVFAFWRHRHVTTISGLVIIGYSLHVIRVGGDFMGLHRFLVPIMPIVACTVGLGILILGQWIRNRWNQWVVWGIVFGVVVIATAHIQRVDLEAMTVGSENGVDRIGWLKKFHEQCTAIGYWLKENGPHDGSLATTAAGIIPYYSRLYTVDILGLNDEWVAHNVPAQGSRPGHTKSAPRDYVLNKDVDYLIYHPTITKGRSRVSARRSPDLASRGYRWRSVQVPGLEPPWWGFWYKSRPK